MTATTLRCARVEYQLDVRSAQPRIPLGVIVLASHHDGIRTLVTGRADVPGAIQAFLKSRELDLSLPPPSWALSRDAFEPSARRAVERLTPRLRTFIRQDEIFVTDAPGAEAIVDGVDPRALVLVDALEGPNGAPTGRLFVYQRNVERLAGSLDRIEDEIRSALEREIAAAMLEIDAAAPPKSSALN